jgi:hypothetical protein
MVHAVQLVDDAPADPVIAQDGVAQPDHEGVPGLSEAQPIGLAGAEGAGHDRTLPFTDLSFH